MQKKTNDLAEYFVSPEGRDTWSGTLAQSNRQGTDGPCATIAAAQKAARRLRKTKGFKRPVRIALRGGHYFLKASLVFQPADSGIPRQGTITRYYDDPVCPLTIAAYPDETPVVSGGCLITGWHEETVNGKQAWVAALGEVKRGAWNFRQLWVNGQRRYRPCLPRQGRYQMAGFPTKRPLIDYPYDRGEDRFLYAPGDLSAQWRNLNDVEIVFPNFWVDQHIRIRHVDARKRLVVLDYPTHTRPIDDSWTPAVAIESCLGFYCVENVFEALDQPGEWYLDRTEGRLYYLPLPDEDITTAEVIAPRLEQVVRIEGNSLDQTSVQAVPTEGVACTNVIDRESCEPVHEIRFEGITFAHTEWALPQGHVAPGIQSACDVTGAVTIRNAHTITFMECAFTHVGGYALECAGATRDIDMVRCEVSDTGAGGVKIWHRCTRTTISDCHIHDGGHVYESGAGILIGRSSGNLILHNAIHDFGYTGIQVGWDWTDSESDSYGNVIEYNHVYNIGRGQLSDLGGIYTLGVAPGTRIRHNVVHDVRCRTRRAWGIYLDAGSSYILVENNLIFRMDDGPLKMNQNRGHTIRNNIFALGKEYQLCRSILVAFPTCTFERNIVCSASSPLWIGNWKENQADLHHNLYFVSDRKRPDFAGMTFQQWQKRGLDAGSLIADPEFRDPANGDFRLKKNSPALKIGFVPWNLAAVGPREAYRRNGL